MARNDLILLDQLIRARQEARAVPFAEDKAFEVFACEQTLRSADLSVEEVEAGIVGGGQDGAIDGVYVFLNDDLLTEDHEIFDDDFQPRNIAIGSKLRLWLVQAKREESYTETAIDLVGNSTKRLLDFGAEKAELLALYNTDVVAKVSVFKSAMTKLASRHLSAEVRFSYVTRGRVDTVNERVRIKAQDLEKQFADELPGGSGLVEFLGAHELWKSASSLPNYTLTLPYQESATYGSSYIALVNLEDYFGFLTEEDGSLRRHIFDLNVRDYQGDVEVNKEIRESLAHHESPEFWWLNNGVTIICSRASIVGGKNFVLDDVQIVNGLQTSHTIHKVLKGLESYHPARRRAVQVRILVTSDASTRDQVIRATNRQTSVPVASLRATDDIQRSIETYFLSHDWYYDRRKNYYRNIGKPSERIVSIPMLAQAVMAIGMGRPDDSRARPSSLLKRDADYKKIFSDRLDLNVYLWLAKAQRDVDDFLLTEDAATSTQERTNLRFHLAMLAAKELHGARIYAPGQLKELAEAETSISRADLPARLRELREYFLTFTQITGDAPDKVAKGPDFVDYLHEGGVSALLSEDFSSP